MADRTAEIPLTDDEAARQEEAEKRAAGRRFMGLSVAFLVLGVITALWQVEHLGMEWIFQHQYEKVLYVTQGIAPAPFVYRPLGYIVAAAAGIGADSAGFPYALAFLVVRMLQNTLIFGAFWAYWRAWKLSNTGALLGLTLLIYAMANSLTDSDLAFDTYGDLLWYGVACWAILTGRDRAVPIVTLFAAATRETSVFIPLLHLIAAYRERERLPYAMMSLVGWILVYGFLRVHFYTPIEMGAYGYRPGVEMIQYNIGRGFDTTLNLLATFSLTPLFLLVRRQALPTLLKWWALLIVPAWAALMLWFGVWAETRLFLEPFAVAVIPAVYFAVQAEAQTEQNPEG